MLKALETLRTLGYRIAILWVLGTNDRARAFYEKGAFIAPTAR